MKRDEFEQFYKDEVGALYRFILVRVSSREVAEDITADSFSRLLERIQTAGIQRPRGYLYQIARNCIADHFKKATATVPIEHDNDAGSGDEGKSILSELERSSLSQSVEAQRRSVDQSIANTQISAMLNWLNEQERAILTLRYSEELDWAEIADRMGKSVIAVRVAHHRILKKIRNRIE